MEKIGELSGDSVERVNCIDRLKNVRRVHRQEGCGNCEACRSAAL
jgi:NADH:ubiquinone oxidoreductase subunit F (NADH-binding)